MVLTTPPEGTWDALIVALKDRVLGTGPWIECHTTIEGILPPWARFPCAALCPVQQTPERAGAVFSVELWLYENLPTAAPPEDNLLGRDGLADGLLTLAERHYNDLATYLPTDGFHDVTVQPIRFGLGISGDEHAPNLTAHAVIGLAYTYCTG